MQLDAEVVRILKDAADGSDALARLFELKRSRAKTFTLGVIARRTDLSKSYLSEVFSGKKRLNPRYGDALSRCLGLSFMEQACLRALVARDAAKDPDDKARFTAELAQVRRALGLVSLSEMQGGEGLLFAFDLYASFGLFGNAPTEKQLRALFKEKPHHEVSECLRFLLRTGAVAQEGDVFRYTDKGVVVSTEGKGADAYMPYWRGAIEDALRNLSTWAPRREESCFTSYVVSVKMEEYKARLEELKASLLKFASACDSAEGDALVRMNLQIFPVRTTGAGGER